MAEKRWKSRKTVKFSDGDVLAHDDKKPIKRGTKRNGGPVPAKDEPEAAAKDKKPKNGKKKAGKQQETEDSKSDMKPAKRANKGKGGATTVEEAPEVAPKNEKAKNGKKLVGKQEKEGPKNNEDVLSHVD